MVAVSVIAILTLLVINTYLGQTFKGYDAKRKGDLDRIKVATEEYEKDNNCYPPAALVKCENGGAGLKPYLNTIPCDPKTHESYAYEPDPEGCPIWFRAYAKLENLGDKSAIPGIGPGGAYNYYVSSPNAPLLGGFASEVPTSHWGCFSGICKPLKENPPGNPVCGPSSTTSDCYSLNHCIPEGAQDWECK